MLLVLLWPNRDWKFVVLLAAVLLNGWLLTISDVFATVEAHNADVYERAYAGLPVTQDEFGQDGVGDRVFALTFGWLVPVLGAAVGFVANALRARLRSQPRKAL